MKRLRSAAGRFLRRIIRRLGSSSIRIETNEDSSLDEVVVDIPDLVHIEQMSDNLWWVGIDVGDEQLVVEFYTGRAKIKAKLRYESPTSVVEEI